MIKEIIKFVLKLIASFWSRAKVAEFETKQHDKASEAERNIRDAIDGVKDPLPPSVDNGDIKGRDDDDSFGNKGWSK